MPIIVYLDQINHPTLLALKIFKRYLPFSPSLFHQFTQLKPNSAIQYYNLSDSLPFEVSHHQFETAGI